MMSKIPELLETYETTLKLLNLIVPLVNGTNKCDHPLALKNPCKVCAREFYSELATVANYLSAEALIAGLREPKEGEYVK